MNQTESTSSPSTLQPVGDLRGAVNGRFYCGWRRLVSVVLAYKDVRIGLHGMWLRITAPPKCAAWRAIAGMESRCLAYSRRSTKRPDPLARWSERCTSLRRYCVSPPCRRALGRRWPLFLNRRVRDENTPLLRMRRCVYCRAGGLGRRRAVASSGPCKRGRQPGNLCHSGRTCRSRTRQALYAIRCVRARPSAAGTVGQLQSVSDLAEVGFELAPYAADMILRGRVPICYSEQP